MIGRVLIVGIRTGSLGRVWEVKIRRRCGRQRELANPVITKGRLNVKKIFAYSATITTATFNTSRFLSWCFFLFYKDCILLSSVKISSCNFVSFLFTFAWPLLHKTLTPLKGWKKKNKQTNWSAGSLFPIPFFLSAKLPQVSLLADWFIVHLGIVVT